MPEATQAAWLPATAQSNNNSSNYRSTASDWLGREVITMGHHNRLWKAALESWLWHIGAHLARTAAAVSVAQIIRPQIPAASLANPPSANKQQTQVRPITLRSMLVVSQPIALHRRSRHRSWALLAYINTQWSWPSSIIIRIMATWIITRKALAAIHNFSSRIALWRRVAQELSEAPLQ